MESHASPLPLPHSSHFDPAVTMCNHLLPRVSGTFRDTGISFKWQSSSVFNISCSNKPALKDWALGCKEGARKKGLHVLNSSGRGSFLCHYDRNDYKTRAEKTKNPNPPCPSLWQEGFNSRKACSLHTYFSWVLLHSRQGDRDQTK